MAGGVLISTLLAMSYPFVVLKLGMGPATGVIAAFLGAIFLNVFARGTRGANGLQNNIIMTMAGSATATAFMCVVMAAFAYLASNWHRDVGFAPSWWQVLLWLTCSGCIGVLFVTRFRRFFMNHPRMKFPAGVAAAVVVQTLDQVGTATSVETTRRARSLGIAALLAGLIAVGRDVLKKLHEWTLSAGYKVGFGFDAVSFGTGLLLPIDVGLSFVLGALVLWGSGAQLISYAGLDASHGEYKAVMLWLMWPASAFMIAASVASLAINMWKARGNSGAPTAIRAVEPAHAHEVDLPLSVVVLGTTALAGALAVIQYVNFGVSPVKTLAAVLAQLVLILAAVWVAGETSFGPVSLMANGAQFFFGLIWRHDVKGNLIAAGMAGDGTAQGEQVMFAYKAGRILGGTPRAMTLAQLMGVPIGALAVGLVFPLLVKVYGIGGDGKLSAPTGLKLANVAVLMDQGMGAFPKGALTATIAAIAVGVLFEVLRNWETQRGPQLVRPFFWVPSPGALGFGLILPPSLSLMIGLGASVSWLWAWRSPQTHARYHQTIAAGLIIGEALIAGLAIPILAGLGLIHV
jgi:uncharacterized oligopeptide transporter (OPT) family protein